LNKNKNNLFVSTQKIRIQYYDKTVHTVNFLSNVPSVSITALAKIKTILKLKPFWFQNSRSELNQNVLFFEGKLLKLK
jgi:hypothetical protein